jgi:hypothetical protein
MRGELCYDPSASMCAGSMDWMAWCDRYGANLFENSTTDMGTMPNSTNGI